MTTTLIGTSGNDFLNSHGTVEAYNEGGPAFPYPTDVYFVDSILDVQGGGGDDWIEADFHDAIDGGSGVDTLAFLDADPFRIYEYEAYRFEYEQYLQDVENYGDPGYPPPAVPVFSGGSGVNLDLSAAFDGGISVGSFGQQYSGLERYGLIVGTSGRDVINVGDGEQIVGVPSYATMVISTNGVYGFEGDDTLSGGVFANSLYGGDGNDILIGGGGGDTLVGGAGIDTASFVGQASGINVSLVTGVMTSDTSNGTALEIENVIGTQFGDTVIGTDDANTIMAGDGDDVVEGGGGNDRIDGGAGHDILTGGTGADQLTGGADNDQLFADQNDTVDGGAGIDTLNLDLSSATGGITANLTAAFSGGTSTVNGHAFKNVEQYVQIIGSDFDDTIAVGNASQGYDGEVTYDGNPGVYGGGGNDTLTGGTAVNYLFGGSGDDVLSAGGGNDYLDGGSGIDSLDGGDGSDYAYIDMGGTTGDIVFVNGGVAGTVYIRAIDGVAAGTVTNIEAVGFIAGSGDDLLGIRQVVPSSSSFLAGAGDDTLVIDYGGSAIAASTQADGVSILSILDGSTATIQYDGFEHLHYTAGSGGGAISGFSGDDILVGGAGDDVFDGGAGFDTVSFASAASAVRASLAITGSQQTLAGHDILTNIEGIIGSAYGDILTGSDGDDVIDGGNGNDTIRSGGGNDLLIGRSGGDILDGGAGIDTVSYADDFAGVRVSLALEGLQRTVGSNNDTLIGIENVTGSAFADRLAGDAGANVIDAGAGDDLVEGGAGDDILIGGVGVDTLTYANAETGISLSLALTAIQSTIGAGSDIVSGFENVTGSAFADALSGDGGANRIDGGAGADHLDGAGGDDWLHGGLGDDVLTGGAGNDTASYDDAISAIILSLASGTVTGGGGNDTLAGIENATGSKFSDLLTGNAGDNILSAEAGNDVLKGGGGADVLTGGRGADAFVLTKATDSAIGQEDVITDFQHDQNDRIDLRLLPGKFSFLGDGDFTGHAAEVHYAVSGSDLLVSGDIDGDGEADFQIKLIGVAEIEASDFFL